MCGPMHRDMWWVMAQKTSSDAYGKVMTFAGSEGGNGLAVFMKLYIWYTKIAQVSVDELRDKCSGPPRANKMEEIPGIIERWKQHVAHLEQVDNEDPFTEKWRITAIRTNSVWQNPRTCGMEVRTRGSSANRKKGC